MSDNQELYLVLVIIYLFDCFFWINNMSVVFSSSFNRRFKISYGMKALRGPRGSLLLLNPFPPLGRVYMCHVSPISFSPEGICSHTFQSLTDEGNNSPPERFITYDEISKVSCDGKKILINGDFFTRCGSEKMAEGLTGFIRELQSSDPSGRVVILQGHLDDKFDHAGAQGKIEKFKKVLAPLPWICNLDFIFLYLAVPSLFLFVSIHLILVPILVMIFYFSVIIIVCYYFAHRGIYPDSVKDRVIDIIKIALCPPLAIRAVDMLSINYVSMYDPTVLARIFSPENGKHFITAYVRDLKNPIRHAFENKRSEGTCKWYRDQLLERCSCYLEMVDQVTDDLLDILTTENGASGCIVYCPRCLSLYTKDIGECSECPGVHVKPLVKKT